jgi:hypothetical protein
MCIAEGGESKTTRNGKNKKFKNVERDLSFFPSFFIISSGLDDYYTSLMKGRRK